MSAPVKRVLRDLRRSAFEFAGSPRYSKPSLGDLHNQLAPYLSFRNGFFIEAGANDGYSQSNTYYLERFLGWKGILVEGIPELHQRCATLRTHSRVYQCALVAGDSQTTHVQMHFADLMSVVDGSLKTPLAQDEQIRRGLEVQALPSTYHVNVPARTLDSILDEYPNLPRIDFLSLDVEGYELDVLRGMDLDKYRPTYILVEARFFDEVDEHLKAHYELVGKLSHHDYLYRSRPMRPGM